MNRFNKFLVAAFMSAAMLLPNMVQAMEIQFDLDAVQIKAKHNHACRMAGLVLQTVTSNRRRHDELQRFMLSTDSATAAVEVPVFFSPADLAHLKDKARFRVPIEADVTLTGHKGAATAATIYGRWHSALRSRIPRFGSWDRRAICSGI